MLTDVSDSIFVRVELIRVGYERAVVFGIQNPVVVVIVVARIPLAIRIRVDLIRIGYGRAVVPCIRNAVVVIIQCFHCADVRIGHGACTGISRQHVDPIAAKEVLSRVSLHVRVGGVNGRRAE